MKENENYPIYHYVMDDKTMPFSINVHTHGLDKYGHLEFECVLPYRATDMQTIFDLLACLVIKCGNHFEEGCYTNIMTDNYRLCFVEVPDHYDESKTVLRIIYPDENGKMPWEDGCEEHYAKQIVGIPAEKYRYISHLTDEVIDARR